MTTRTSAQLVTNMVRSPRRRIWLTLLVAVAGLLTVARLLSVDVIPTVTNDSISYLAHSQALTDTGFVQFGYRQFAYPTYLAITNLVGNFLGIDPLLMAVAIQRFVLIGALAYLTWLLRWWAVPLLFLFTTSEFLAYTNFVLIEGLALPLVVLLGGVVSHRAALVVGSNREELNLSDRVKGSRLEITLLALGTALALVLLSTRLSLGLLALSLIPAYWWGIRAPNASHRRATWIIGAIAALVALLVVAGISRENAQEVGTSSPLAGSARTEYWGAWQLTFKLNPSNQDDEALSRWWSGGKPFGVVREIEANLRTYPDQSAAFDKEVETMLSVGGLNRGSEQLRSIAWAFRGGRHHDVHGIVERMLDVTPETVEDVIYSNQWVDARSTSEFDRKFNEGAHPGVVLTSAAFPDFAPISLSSLLRLAGPLSLLLLLGSLFVAPVRATAAWTFIPSSLTLTAMGSLLLDNLRYLLPALALAATVAVFCLMADFVQLTRSRSIAPYGVNR